MNAKRPRTDADNLKLLDQLRPTFEQLKAERIRAESEIDRLTKELEAARADARRELGTDDEEELRRMILTTQEENTALVDSFSDAIRDIERRLANFGDDV